VRQKTTVHAEIAAKKKSAAQVFEAKLKETNPEETGGGKKVQALPSKVWKVPAASYSAQYHDTKLPGGYCAVSAIFSV
jgi:hypothetical protein